MTAAELASKIDHTILKPEATSAEVHRVATEAMQNRFASVCVAPCWVSQIALMLKGSGTPVCTVVSFPHGTSKSTVKAIEATAAVKDGADEVDVVAHLPYLMNADTDATRAELMEVVRATRAARREVVVKVIVESALLMRDGVERGEERLDAACRAVRESGCDFIKTSTGFHPAGGASADAVRLMRKYGEGIKVKASGGIRDLATARGMLDAGADRLGLSASIQIVNELNGAATASAGQGGY
jgi:deoxyribose-phosphate aldolase